MHAKPSVSQFSFTPTGGVRLRFGTYVWSASAALLPGTLQYRRWRWNGIGAASPKVRDRLTAAGFEPNASLTSAQLAQSVKSEYERNAAIVKSFNIQLNQ